MTDVIAAFASAVVGGLIVLYGGTRSHRLEVERERANRWLGDRRAVYASFLRAMNDVMKAAGPKSGPEARNKYEVEHEVLLTHWGEMQLLAPPRIMLFADGIRDWSIDMGITLNNHLENQPERADWKYMRESYWVLRRDLLDECRRDLGIPLAETLEHVVARGYAIPVYHPDVK